MDLIWKYVGSTELVICCLTVFCVVLLHGIFGPLFYWWKRGVPSLPAFPLIGSMLDTLLQRKFIGDFYMDMYKKLEGKRYGGFLKFTKPAIILRDPELIKTVLDGSFPSFHDNDLALNEDIEPLFGRNLFVLTGERWKQLRADLSHAFTPEKIKVVYPFIQEVCNNLHSYLEENAGSETEMKDLCARFTSEVVSSCAFGIHSDAIHIPNSEFRLMALEMLNPSPLRAGIGMTLLHFPWILRFVPMAILPDKVTNFFRRLVREVATHRDREDIHRNDFMDSLIELKKDGKLGVKLTKERTGNVGDNETQENTKGKGSPTLVWDPESIDDVAAQALGFFIDGSETSASLMSFAFYELAHNSDIQEKLRNEIREVKLRHGGILSYEALQDMPYLEMVLLETLRKYPPASFIARLTTKPHKLPSPELDSGLENDILLELDTPVIVPVLAIHRDPKYYPEPEVFDPGRFSANSKNKRNRFTFLPFGEGPRICIGKRFGLLKSKAAISSVLLSFQLMPSDQTLPPITFDTSQFLTSSKNQLWVYVKKLKLSDD